MTIQTRTSTVADLRVNLPLVLLLPVVVAYALSPGPVRAVIYLLVDLSCVAGIVLAQRGRPRSQSRLWVAVAVGMVLSTVGDVALFAPILVHGHADAVPMLTNVAFVAAYAASVVAIAIFVRRTGVTTKGDLLDASVFAIGILALAWPVLGLAAARSVGVTSVLQNLAFPLASLTVLCVGLLAATTGAWRVSAVRGLVAASVIGFVATVVLGTAAARGDYAPGSLYDIGWLPVYLLVLRTALAERRRPLVSVLESEGRVGAGFRVISSSRIAALTAALVAAPLSDALFHFSRRDEVLFLVLTSVAIGLVGIRLWGLMGHVRHQAREMRARALYDAVTGLPNREHLREAAIRALGSTGQHALVFVDLDDFKTVNDTRGHAIGDELLLAVSGRLSHAARHHDLVARLGGDEFAVLMSGAPDDARVAAERFLRALSDAPIEVCGQQHTVRASAGVTLLEPRPGADPDEVYQDALAEADIAMYAAKRSGGGRSRCYEATLRDDVLGSNELADDLGNALAAGALDVEFQPIVTTADGTAVAMEALVRWNHPTRGRLMPSTFLPMALERGMLSRLDLVVLDQALAGAATWRAVPGAEHVVVHFNASPALLARHEFVGHVARSLAAHGLPGCALVVEITEQSLVEPGDVVANTLRGLRELGVFVALDDFGTGYSSLSYLGRFDIDTLKLDRSFLLHGAMGDARTPLLEAVLHLARTLGMAVVAEGVETTQQRDSLVEMSCPLAQGFLFSASLGLERAVEWLEGNQGERALPSHHGAA